MEAATWSNCARCFAFNGTLIDLLVPGTGPDEWERFWSALRGGPFALEATRDGEPIALPASAAWWLADARAFDAVLAVMRCVADGVGLPVFAAEEAAGHGCAFLRVSPDGFAERLG